MKRLGVFTAIVSLCLLMLPMVASAQDVPPNCGDGRIQWRQGETCDPPGTPCGAGGRANFICNDFCQCVPAEPVCGDGIVQWKAGEECEPGVGDECGFGRLCDPTSCICVDEPGPSQACCSPDGLLCEDMTVGECREEGGTPQGSDTECATTSCPLPPQACCAPDGTCMDTTTDVCTSFCGEPQGDGTDCTTIFCPRPEACCSSDGLLCEDLLPEECESLGRIPQGRETDCATTVCPRPEACCFPNQSCSNLFPADCTASGGSPMGPGSDCTTIVCPEACCLPGASCELLTVADCNALGGTRMLTGDCAEINCSLPSEACCYGILALCEDMHPQVCENAGLLRQGPGTTCATVSCPVGPTEACCLPGGGCADLPAISCGGTPKGPGTTCAETSCP